MSNEYKSNTDLAGAVMSQILTDSLKRSMKQAQASLVKSAPAFAEMTKCLKQIQPQLTALEA